MPTAPRVALRIGVLGDAGVGKTTLLNALVGGGRSILPAGGVGPVTGRATRLHHAPAPVLTLRYLPARRALELCYALEHLDASSGGRPVRESEYLDRLPADVRAAARAAATSPEGRLLAKDARLLVVGDPDSSEPLVRVRGGLRMLLGLPIPATGAAFEPDPLVLFRCRQVLRAGERRVMTEQSLDLVDEAARERLNAHVAGPLSVLTEEVSVGWPSELLASGLELVDLPGLGVALDPHQRVTRTWLRERQVEGILLVCTRGGITSSCERALEESGALAELVAAWRPSSPSIVIAVTKLDDEAAQLRRQDRTRSAPTHFAELAEASKTVLRSQLLGTLRRTLVGVPQARLEAIAAGTPVIAVAATDYQSLHHPDPELPPTLPTLVETNVPRLTAALDRLTVGRQRVRAPSDPGHESRLASRSPR